MLGVITLPLYPRVKLIPQTSTLSLNTYWEAGIKSLNSPAFFFLFLFIIGKKQPKIKEILSNKKLREHNSYAEVLDWGYAE